MGTNVRALADEHGIPIWKGGRLNKGWAGQALECHLGLEPNSRRAPDFGDWELKVVSLTRDRDDRLRVKETMAITMIDRAIVSTRFEESALFHKLRRMVLVARVYEHRSERHSPLWGVTTFDLDPDLARLIQADYRRVQDIVRVYGLEALDGRIGRLVQPRPKGPGHGSTSRAFYARTRLIAHVFNL